MLQLLNDRSVTGQLGALACLRYWSPFIESSFLAGQRLCEVQKNEALNALLFPLQQACSCAGLTMANLQILSEGLSGGTKDALKWFGKQFSEWLKALTNTYYNLPGEGLDQYYARQKEVWRRLVVEYPEAVEQMDKEFGFHFDDGGYQLIAQNEHFVLWQIFPRGQKAAVDGKPTLIIPPQVLGPNILAFLPDEGISYAHAFAKRGGPTFIRITKGPADNPRFYAMTGEDDISGTLFCCQEINRRCEGQPMTLNGYCQGGFLAALAMMTGKLKGLVNALITCVAPMDGTRSPGMASFSAMLPERDLKYATTKEALVSAALMSWVYRIKSIGKENPLSAMFRDLDMVAEGGIGKKAATLGYWLVHEPVDLSVGVTQLSFKSYTHPPYDDGTLSFTLFNNLLSFGSITEPWLLNYADKDDLVEEEAACAPADYISEDTLELKKVVGGHTKLVTVDFSDPAIQYIINWHLRH